MTTQRIEHVDVGAIEKILDSGCYAPGRYEPQGLYLAVTPDGFIAMDNSTHEAWMERFKSRNVIDSACFELDFAWVAVVPFASIPLTPGFQGWVENALERRFIHDGIITAVVPRDAA